MAVYCLYAVADRGDCVHRIVFAQLCALFLCTVALAGDPVVQHHLLMVAAALRAETPARLDPATRARRLAHLDALEAYARAGAFPQPETVGSHHRSTQPPRGCVSPDGPRMPMFVDGRGTHCAVGHLVAQDDPALVTRVVAEANTAWVADTFDVDTPGAGDATEQFQIDLRGGIENLDNKKNVIKK